MGIIDDYLTGSSVETPAIKSIDSGLINSFLNAPEEKLKVSREVKPPISGVSKEASEEINSQPAKKGGANPRPGLETIPLKAGGKIYKAASEGLNEAAGGVGDVFSGKPVTGVGKVGMGLMGVAGSLFEGAGSVAADLTGNEAIGNKAAIVAGSAVPVQGAKAVANNLPRNKALRELVDKITSGGRDNQALVDTINAMKADSRIGPADTSPAVLNMAQKLFTTEGDVAKNYLYNTSKSRVSNLPTEVKEAFDVAGGTPVNVVNKLNELSTAAKKAGTDLINPALAAAKPVNITKTLEGIDEVLKPGIWSKISGETTLPLNDIKAELVNIKKYLANKTEMRTDAKDLHSFQSGLRRTAEALEKSSNAGERQLGHAIRNVRNNLVNDIEASATGYKAGLAKYREESHIADSFRDGYNNVFSTSTKMEGRPEFTKQWFDSLTDAEKEAAREGARLAIDSKMGASGNASLAGTRLAQSDFNKQKLEILFGKEETETLLRKLENTRSIKNTDQKLVEGSQTQMRAAGDEAIALPVKGESGSILNWALPAAAEAYTAMQGAPGVGAGIGVALVGAKAAASKFKHDVAVKLAKERNAHLAKLSLPTEGPSRDQLIKELESFLPKPKQSLLSRVKLPIAP